jgi:Cu/Ag efflux protein CusF
MNTIRTTLIAVTLAAIGAAGSAAPAQTTMDQRQTGDMTMADAGAGAGEMTDAEVRKVDQELGKVTLKHGPIKHLDMPGMTMVFTVKDKSLLDGVKRGDKIRFRAADENGRMIVTQIQPVR